MKNLYKALAAFQQEVPVILKETSGHNYKYADLPAIDEVVKPLLKKHGISYIQPLSNIDGKPSIKTIIFSADGLDDSCIEENHPMPEFTMAKVATKKTDKSGNVTEAEKYVVAGMEQMSLPQANGSMITYYRRYCLSSALGLITDKDNDGAGQSTDGLW